MNTEITNALQATEKETQYDECAKRLLGNKHVLAHILVKTVDEFQGMNPKDVIVYIEGDVCIGTVPVEPGLTNKVMQCATTTGKRIVGLNTENKEILEGEIRFDMIFYVRTKVGLSQVIINVEAQQSPPKGYDLLNRGIFYGCRMISSQKERDFEKMNYNDIKRVYSIWVCMNMEENSLNHIHLINDAWLGCAEWKGKLDMFNVIMIGLSKELPEQDEQYELHRLLGLLFGSHGLTNEQKLNMIQSEYEIPTEDVREEVSVMCNLSQGIKEEGIRQGMQQGMRQGISLGVENLSTAIKRLQRGELAETLLSDGIDENTVREAEEIVLSFRSRVSDIV